MSTDAFDEILKRSEQLSSDERQQLIAHLSASKASDSAPDHNNGSSFVQPQTQLGARLREIRSRIVQSGMPLLELDQLDAEVSERRGEMTED